MLCCVFFDGVTVEVDNRVYIHDNEASTANREKLYNMGQRAAHSSDTSELPHRLFLHLNRWNIPEEMFSL